MSILQRWDSIDISQWKELQKLEYNFDGNMYKNTEYRVEFPQQDLVCGSNGSSSINEISMQYGGASILNDIQMLQRANLDSIDKLIIQIDTLEVISNNQENLDLTNNEALAKFEEEINRLYSEKNIQI